MMSRLPLTVHDFSPCEEWAASTIAPVTAAMAAHQRELRQIEEQPTNKKHSVLIQLSRSSRAAATH
jgi:hypothetical protein